MRKSPRWRFTPPLWSWLAVLPLLALLLGLCRWQYQRGVDKAALLAAYLQAQTQPAQALDARQPAPREGALKVQLRGRYEVGRDLLQDNQTHQQRPGQHLWTPLRSAQGLVLVNRGWLPLGAGLEAAPAGEQTVSGLWRALPRAGLALQTPCEAALNFPATVNYPDAGQLRCLLGEPVAPGLLLLDPAAPGGLVREWNFNQSVPPERHYAYAVQWGALALTLLLLFIKLNLKRTDVLD